MDSVARTLLSYLVRTAHVVAAALILGGPVALWEISFMNANDIGGNRSLLTAMAKRYEGAFWTSMGILVMTGVGNLGAFGASLQGAETKWGSKFLIKLMLVIVFLLFSLARSLALFGLAVPRPGRSSSKEVMLLRGLYIGTEVFGISIVTVALLLAHG